MSGGGFAYRDGQLCCEDVPLAEIAADAGTPVYVYSANAMRRQLRAYQHAFGDRAPLFCYALKANANLAIIRLLADQGAGADTVSAGEVQRALAAGVPPARIVFAGVAKGDDEIAMALDTGILQFNIESPQELERIAAIAQARRLVAPVALRINPEVTANTHAKISTGRRGDKFGIALEDALPVYARAHELAGIEPVGIHLHIGSQITDLAPFRAAYACGAALFRQLRAQGLPASRLDLGGGFGVRYRNEARLDPAGFAKIVSEATAGLDCELMFEPGRALVAEAGVLVASVIYGKQAGGRRFLILDAGMHTLIRPAMYDAYHEIVPVEEPSAAAPPLVMDVVGPICESSDVFGRDRALPAMATGDLVALESAGAYGAAMASDYNSRPRAAEVLVDGARWAVIKPRRTAEEQFRDERIPDWISGDGGSG